jgi:adenylylsulfate kinase
MNDSSIFIKILKHKLVNNQNRDIFPESFNTLLRKKKERLLNQNAKVIWMTGLSGAGKTTLAKELEFQLINLGYLSYILDGDNIRAGINNNLSFSDADRVENIRRIAEVSKLFIDCGIITINCFISPTDSIRDMAKRIIGPENFIEVFVNAPFDICEERDVKGLYSRARKGEIKDFTGIDAPFDTPRNPDIMVHTDTQTIEESVRQILDYVLPRIKYERDPVI